MSLPDVLPDALPAAIKTIVDVAHIQTGRQNLAEHVLSNSFQPSPDLAGLF
jgi:hypothetical protein